MIAPRAVLILLAIATLGVAHGTRKQLGGGTEFYIAFPREGFITEQPGVVINSRAAQTVHITPPNGNTVRQAFTNGTTHLFATGSFPAVQEPDKVLTHAATHIVCERLASVHGQMGVNAIAGTFTALPVSAWGTDYVVLDAPEGDNEYASSGTAYSVPGITIIAAQNGTSVSITPTNATAGGHKAGLAYTATLDAGDVYYITTPADPHVPSNQRVFAQCEADFSGTRIMSSRPVGVVVSQSLTSFPCLDVFCSDYGVEWLPPVANWDTAYVWASTAIRTPVERSDGLRVAFAENNTELRCDDGAGEVVLGRFNSTDVYDYHPRNANGCLFTADKPILLLSMTSRDSACNATNHVGGPWNFGMTFMAGVHQWPSRLLFSDAHKSAGSFIGFVCREADKPRIRVSGLPFTALAPTSLAIAGGYSAFHVGFGQAAPNSTYNAATLECDSGATAWGAVWGYGTGASLGTLPKSYGHMLSIPDIPLVTTDTDAPACSITSTCGTWVVHAVETADSSTGLGESLLDDGTGADTSFNCALVRGYAFGDLAGTATISVLNLTQPARAALRVRDLAGNEFDTVLAYAPLVVDASPSSISIGPIAAGDSVDVSLTLHNRSASPVQFASGRLLYGAAHRWSIVTHPAFPFTLAPGDSARFTLRYHAAAKPGAFDDEDSLLLTTCREFQVAYLHASLRRAAAAVMGASLPCLRIDTLGVPSDTMSSRAIGITNVGTDSLEVTGVTLIGISPADLAADVTHDVSLANAFLPARIAPGDTQFVGILVHPHHSGDRTAAIVFASNAPTSPDTALITFCGVERTVGVNDPAPSRPGIFALDAYPNPVGAADGTTIAVVFTLPQPEHVHVTLSTMLGVAVVTMEDGLRDAGVHTVNFDGSSLHSGVYLCTVRTERGTLTQRVIVSR